MFTDKERKAIVFLCAVFLLGAALKIGQVNYRYNNGVASKQKVIVKININSACLEELKTVPSIGPKTAHKIIQYRQQKGSFSSLDDLKEIKGIGDKKINIIKDFIVF